MSPVTFCLFSVVRCPQRKQMVHLDDVQHRVNIQVYMRRMINIHHSQAATLQVYKNVIATPQQYCDISITRFTLFSHSVMLVVVKSKLGNASKFILRHFTRYRFKGVLCSFNWSYLCQIPWVMVFKPHKYKYNVVSTLFPVFVSWGQKTLRTFWYSVFFFFF